MSFYDKSRQIGYDETDKELQQELEEMLKRVPPRLANQLHNRIHDGIMQRLKEDGAKKCYTIIEAMEKCINETGITKQGQRCSAYRDALNQCYHEVHTEEAYQRYRIMYLRGELLKLHDRRMAARVEGMKAASPDITPKWKLDYGDKLIAAHQRLGLDPLAQENVLHDDLAGKPFPPT